MEIRILSNMANRTTSTSFEITIEASDFVSLGDYLPPLFYSLSI